MKRTLFTARQLVAMALCLMWAASAAAQTGDHLKCYKVRDPQAKILYTADLGGLVAEPGCRIKVPAAMACVPASKTNVTPIPPGGGGTGTPGSFFCYKVKCPRATLPTINGTDQFGSRTVTPSTAKLLCAPLAAPSTTTSPPSTTSTSTTTTTSTTTSMTTTTLRFVDNGDGTVIDNQTGLQWEQKTDDASVHDHDNQYSWSDMLPAPDGMAFTNFLAALNGGATGVGNCVSSDGSTQTGGFAGHCDWRLPTIVELQTILDCSFFGCTDPVFGPTKPNLYWSSTTAAGNADTAWSLSFNNVGVSALNKGASTFVRAVRGGS